MKREEIKEYVLKNYPKTFKKKIVIRNKGRLVSTSYQDLEPIVTECDNHWEVKAHKDASPIILSKL